jgi:NAD+ synthase (glutamine-hydrolysing)
MNIQEHGYIRVGSTTINTKIGNPKVNAQAIFEQIKVAVNSNIQVLVFPEMCLVGYTAQDLLFQEELHQQISLALDWLLAQTSNINIAFIIGVPYKFKGKLFSSAFVCQSGKIQGIVLKQYLPNYNEFYEKRWFESGIGISGIDNNIQVGTNLLFKINNALFGIEICEDLWAVNSPSNNLALAGATIIFNLSASNEKVGKDNYRQDLIRMQSAKAICGYVYSSSNIFESTSDIVFSGATYIFENGSILSQGERFSSTPTLIFNDIDIQAIQNNRLKNTSFTIDNSLNYLVINLNDVPSANDIVREYSKTPFISRDNLKKKLALDDISNIQISGLARRLIHLNNSKVILGLSGGLDSTLALLVIYETFIRYNFDLNNIIAVSMPGFGTSSNTFNNSKQLCKKLNIPLLTISIKKGAIQQLKDLNHPLDLYDVTYENIQARLRTLTLMNLANQEQGIVVGTGDLSEIALGWNTYNGDHMSMYNVNCSVPKTVVKDAVKYYTEKYPFLKNVLIKIIDTPISPELTPGKQETEAIIGKYELHDFFLYHFLRHGFPVKKILYIAIKTFPNVSSTYITEQLKTFIKRFFIAQYKRNCVPDGPKVGSISLSPRGDFRLASEVDFSLFLAQLDD